MNGFNGEFFGTLILILIGGGCSASVNLKRNYAHASGWWFVCVSWGLAVTMGVYVAGRLGSAGHLNPAVTIPYAICGLFPWRQVLPYLAGQFLGAFVGAALVIVFYYPQFKATKTDKEGNSVGIFATRPAIRAAFFNFFSEVVATFAFIFILLNLGNFTTGMKPFIVGLVITVIGTGLGSTTGFALNPARDWSPRLAYTILPVPNKSSAEWWYAWVPMVGPLTGGLLACLLETALL